VDVLGGGEPSSDIDPVVVAAQQVVRAEVELLKPAVGGDPVPPGSATTPPSSFSMAIRSGVKSVVCWSGAP
jgi:hypothetical protein